MTHGKQFDASKHEISDGALVELYTRLAAQNAPKPGSFSALGEVERRAYFRDAKRRSRADATAAANSGNLKPTKANVRAALADAALMLLAIDGPGAGHVRDVLGTVFAARPGLPLTVTQKARNGRLKPKLVGRPA